MTQSLELSDGRTLTWAESGDSAGEPVLYFHGAPGDHHPIVPGQSEIARALGVRLVCPVRPGFGGSTPHPERSLVSWADDVAQLADALSLERFGVVGFSAGAPHALSCAAGLPARVQRAVAVGCGAPWTEAGLAGGMDWQRRVLRRLALHAPWLLRLIYKRMPDPKREPDKLVRQLLAGLSEPDRAVLARPEVAELAIAHTVGALAQGFDGMADEVLVLARPWGFDLAAIRVPLTFVTGTLDSAAPISGASYLAAAIPGARLEPIEGEGHLCIIDHWGSVLEMAVPRG